MDCLLCGVGGQGTVLASRLIAEAAMNKGVFARTSETIGMAQRGGCVVSHVRTGETNSPLIPAGSADIIIAFEPGEGVRCLPYLRENGTVVVCPVPVQAVTASLSGETEDGDKMVDYIKSKAARVIVVDALRIISDCGSPKVLNTALLGAAAASGCLGLDTYDIENALRRRLPAKVIEMNIKALALGAASIKE